MPSKKGDAFPAKVIIVIILLLLILVISILFATGTLREVFANIANYLAYAKEGAPQSPSAP